jgi:hypothetical protein
MKKQKSLRIILTVVLIALLALGTGLTAFATLTAYPDPCNGPKVTPVLGNTVPSYFVGWPQPDPYAPNLPKPDGTTLVHFKVNLDQNELNNGQKYEDGNGFEVTIFKAIKDGKSYFAFEANKPVFHVYAKGGSSGGNLYMYYPEYLVGVTSDCGLSQPGGNWSHIAFYYGGSNVKILGSIAGLKFHDLNANGELDADEPPLEGWRIELYSDEAMTNLVEFDVTDEFGVFAITGLEINKTYYIKEVLQPDWYQSTPNPNYFTVTLTEDRPDYPFDEADEPLRFGNYQYAIKSGYKFEDLNANGDWELGEPVLENWTIHLWTDLGAGLVIVDTTKTDVNGYYEFNELMPSVDYFVSEVIPADWFQSYPKEGTEGALYYAPAGGYVWGPINLSSGEEEKDNNFGNYRYATKSGYKWNDLNNDGVWDPGEPVLANWTIKLWKFVGDNLTVVGTTITDANGYYEFDSLMPGVDYFVSEELVAGWTQTYPNAGTTGALLVDGVGYVWGPINLNSGEVEENNNFGNYRECEWIGETAWAAGPRYTVRGNWATYTPYVADSTVTLYAGQTKNAGTVHFSAVVDGKVTITITLNSGWRFEDVDTNVMIQGYNNAPSGNPAPGRFATKRYATGNSISIEVPSNNFYGVHVNVEWAKCE